MRLSGRVRVIADGSSGTGPYRVRFGERLLQFPRGMHWIVEQLDGRSLVAMRQLMAAIEGRLDYEMARTLLAMLMQQGLIVVLE